MTENTKTGAASAVPVADGHEEDVPLGGEDDPVIRLLNEWLADESGYDEAVWPELKEALNRERALAGARKLFRD